MLQSGHLAVGWMKPADDARLLLPGVCSTISMASGFSRNQDHPPHPT
jgi:hypothetical protein